MILDIYSRYAVGWMVATRESAVLAEKLHRQPRALHRSTLKYRLKRIRELLGRDLNDGPTRLNLHLATRVWLTLESLHRTE